MGCEWEKCLPDFLRGGRKSLYLFDAWSPAHEEIAYFVRALGVSHLFISASQAAQQLDAKLDIPCEWVPEAADPSQYRALPPGDRDIDVLQLGRRYDALHSRICDGLKERGRTHRFEERRGAIIFPTHSTFIDGLARTRISICVPASETHPERAGGIETVTARYFQSMAAKCVIVGRAPRELIELFGYNPVIEIDWSDPVGQIEHILDGASSTDKVVERNHRTLVASHTWEHRWRQIAAALFGSNRG